MNSAAIPTLAAIAIQSALALAVFQANPRRKSNQCFLLLSAVIAAWLGSLYCTFVVSTETAGAFYIRQASAAGAWLPVVYNLLRLCIRNPEKSWREILLKARVWLVAAALITVYCHTEFFLLGAEISSDGLSVGTFTPVYGPGLHAYIVYFAVAGVALLINYIRDVPRSGGSQRVELGFMLIGAAVMSGTLLVAFLLRIYLDETRLIWFAPFRIVLFSLIIAYGMATRKIMDIGVFVRRAIAYAVLTTYLLVLYGVVWWLIAAVTMPSVGAKGAGFAHVIAAIIVAFAMAPARGVSQTLADRLFIGSKRLDFRATVSKATNILRTVSRVEELLEKFARTIREAVGTERVIILLPSRIGYAQHYPAIEPGSRTAQIEFAKEDALIAYLQEHQEAVVLEELHRIRLTPQLEIVVKQMESLEIAVALAIFSREHLAGVMLLGPRVSGRIYGTVEQTALQVLCGQLAVAIENAQLFTEVQNAKIYNEILLQNLTTGVIAAGMDGRISVVNNEAEIITGLKADRLVDQTIGHLPYSLQTLMRETLRSGQRQENQELVLDSDDGALVLRASSSAFHDQEGQMLGALVVLTDITAVKRLEMQIRRSDRLASLGTLSAGMAHEIKNPLVSIKTFAQLLPERYQDSDFRATFSNLIGHEIDRIDTLVNQLLRFARPAKPLLKPLHVHDILEKSLMLVAHRLYQKDIKLSRSWKAIVDTIRADADQLEQVFLNFFLNAMDAMKKGGELNVSTEIRSPEEWATPLNGSNGRHEVLRITVRDNGEGIRKEDIAHVFDPFFTTKDYGTGLGLSVVHGIIQEHGGQIEVESELAKGTSFHILLPLVRFDEEVAAA